MATTHATGSHSDRRKPKGVKSGAHPEASELSLAPLHLGRRARPRRRRAPSQGRGGAEQRCVHECRVVVKPHEEVALVLWCSVDRASDTAGRGQGEEAAVARQNLSLLYRSKQ